MALVRASNPQPGVVTAYKNQLIQERNRVGHLARACASRMLAMAAEIVGFTYLSKSGYRKPAKNALQFRRAWLESEGDDEARMKVCFMWHYFAEHCHRVVYGYRIHRDIAVEEIQTIMNVVFSDEGEMKVGETNCISQIYSREFGQMKANMMKKDGPNPHNVKCGVKVPKGYANQEKSSSVKTKKKATLFYCSQETKGPGGEKVIVSGHVRKGKFPGSMPRCALQLTAFAPIIAGRL
jgi:hypothetical protein